MGYILKGVNIFIPYYVAVATFMGKIDVSAVFIVCGLLEYWIVCCPVL